MWSTYVVIAVLGVNGILAAPDCAKPPAFTDIKGLSKCCDHPDALGEDLAEKCIAEITSAKTDEEKGLKASCAVECALKDTGVIENGEINVEGAKTYLKTSLASAPDLLEIYINSLDKCIEEAKEKLKDVKLPEGYCKPLPSMVVACVGMNGFINCPAPKWSGTDQCNEVRDFMKACTV